MDRSWRLGVLALFVLLLCPSLQAYQLAMKDGRTLEFQKYRVEGGKVFYTDASGKEASVALSEVDLERTKTLNAKETLPLDLSSTGSADGKPAVNSATGQAANTPDEPSLGDAARKLRQQGKAHPTSQKRRYTDEDVQGPASGGLPTLKTAAGDQKSDGAPSAQKAEEKKEDQEQEITEQDVAEYYDLDREQTARGILNYAKLPPDTPFPDRADWEFRLYETKQDMAHAFMYVKEHSEDEKGHEEFRQKWNRFATVANEGIGKAKLYLQTHPQG
jgi:hypothetical protein